MCGIFGFAKLKENNLNAQGLQHALRYLALRNQSRGKDSTGLAVVMENADTFSAHKVATAEGFLDSAAVAAFIESHLTHETRLALGHTRAATTGAVTRLNAQPFTVGAVTGTHNGVIRNYAELFTAHGLTPATECDSEVIFALLNSAATLPEQAKLLSELEGYFALAWHDRRDPQALFLARSSGTLYAACAAEKRFLFWSSERDTLEALFRILGLSPDWLLVPFDGILRVDLQHGTEQEQRIPTAPRSYRYASEDFYGGYGGSYESGFRSTSWPKQKPAHQSGRGSGQHCSSKPGGYLKQSLNDKLFNRQFRKRLVRMLRSGGLPQVFRTGFCEGCSMYCSAGRIVQTYLICTACEGMLLGKEGGKKYAQRAEGATESSGAGDMFQRTYNRPHGSSIYRPDEDAGAGAGQCMS